MNRQARLPRPVNLSARSSFTRGEHADLDPVIKLIESPDLPLQRFVDLRQQMSEPWIPILEELVHFCKIARLAGDFGREVVWAAVY